MSIILLPYQSTWPSDFALIKAQLETLLATPSPTVPYNSIEHIGSTSIPSLCAKPIIDVDIIVTAPNLPAAIIALTFSHAYTHLGERAIPGRHAFLVSSAAVPDKLPPRNVYVCLEDCLALRNHLAVRDVLRRDQALREEYSRVKIELAAQEGLGMEGYVEGKSEILSRILMAAGFGESEREGIREVNVKGSDRT